MTENTSPSATLSAKLPRGNGLTRAVESLHSQRGTLVPFIGYLRVDETGEDLNDALKIKTSIQRLELCVGDIERDAKDLIARASYAANAYPGQMTLMAAPGTAAALAEDRDRYIGYLREWQKEQDPPISDADAAQQWNDFGGGNYGTLDQAAPAYLREFLLSVGALPDDPAKPDVEPPFSDDDADDDDDDEPDGAE